LKSQKHHPGKKFFLAQVGRVAGLLKWVPTELLKILPALN
jgi:hypothetical protein